MKNKIYIVCFSTLLLTGVTAYGQVYRTAADTVKLNKEFTEVSNDIANLSAQLTIAQNNMPGYQSKAKTAESNAQDAAETSSAQAAKATEGSVSVKEARKAKRKSKKAYHEAKDARSANTDVGNQDDKIASLTAQLTKKQERLRELTDMRASINAERDHQ